MKKILKRFTIIIMIFIMLLSLCANKEVKADSSQTSEQAECGNILAAFCINFWNDHHEQTIWDASSNREITYTGQTINGIYHFDCVGWVSFAVHQSLKLGDETFTYFAVPPGNGNNPFFANGFELIKGSATDNSVQISIDDIQPGDILFATGHNHVLIYVGEVDGVNTVIHSSSGTLSKDSVYDAESSYCAVGRITSQAASQVIQAGNASEFFNGQGGISRNDIANGGYEYRGLQPNRRIGMRTFDFKWVIPSLGDLLNYYIGISTYLTRAVYVGLIETVEILIDNTMEAVSGTEASLTIEKLLFNKVPILDVNFFNFETAGGETIVRAEEGEQESVLYVIRENIAIWYNVLRNLSIILLLITLIYIGIRIAISSVAEEKARYKDLLKSWGMSFIIVFSIHYVMIFILTMNQTALDGIMKASTALTGEESLYDSVRNGAYALQATVGFRSLFFYAILVYMLIRFLWTYIKRFIVVSILTLMAPLVGIIYALDKIRDNRAQSFERWFKEYLFNVIIQSVHAFLYALFVGLALNVANQSFIGVFIALILFMFILKAESIFKQIFGIKSGNMTDVLKNAAAFALTTKAVKTIVGTNFKVMSKINSPVTKPLGEIHKRAETIRRDKRIDALAARVQRAKDAGRTSINIGKTSSWMHPSRLLESNETFNFGEISDLDARKIAKSLYEKKEALDSGAKKELANRLSQTANTAMGVGLSAVAIPAIAIDGAKGITPLFLGRAHLKKGIKGVARNSKNFREYKGVKGAIQKAGTARANEISAGMFSTLSGMIRLNRDYIEERQNAIHNAEYEVLKKEMDKKARKEFEKLLDDATIDEKELKRVYSQARSRLSEDTIQNVVFRIDARKDGYITHEISTIAATTDINQVSKEMNSSMKKRKKVYEFDKKGFDEQIKAAVRKQAADDLGIKSVNVSDAQIEAKYSSLTNAQREKIIQQVLDGTSNLTEDRMENDKWRKKDKLERTGMDLNDVDRILDTLTDETHRLNRDKVKENFKALMKSQVAELERANIERGITQTDINTEKNNYLARFGRAITDDFARERIANRLVFAYSRTVNDAQINHHISNSTHDSLIKSIKEVSALNTSVVDDDLIAKPEFFNLLNMVERAKDAEIKMKGKK